MKGSVKHQDKIFRARTRAALIEHFDANEAMFLERELTQLRATTYTTEYAELLARTFAPKATDISPTADTYSYKVYTPTGAAELIAYKGGELPRVDTAVREVFGYVRPIGAAYGYDLMELRRAAELGTSLDAVKAMLVRDAIERGIDECLAFGSLPNNAGNRPDVGLNGLINNSDVASPLSGLYWDDATSGPEPAEVLADLNKLVANMAKETKNVFRPNTILLPTAKYEHVKQTPYSELTGKSILATFLENNKEITTVAPWWRLDDAGASSAPRAISYFKDKKVLEAVIPQEFESMAPQWKGLEALINCHARCGGVKIYLPIAVNYMDFATS